MEDMIAYVLQNKVSTTIVESAIGLLWRISCEEAECQSMYPRLCSTEIVASMLVITERAQGMVVLSSCFGFIANVATNGILEESAPQAASRVCSMLRRESITEHAATCGMHSLCNLLAERNRRDLIESELNVISDVLDTMKRFPTATELQELACLSVSYACINNSRGKQEAIRLGAPEIIYTVLQTLVISWTQEPMPELKDAILCALVSLSACEEGSSAMAQCGLSEVLETMLQTEEDEIFQGMIEMILGNNQSEGSSNLSSSSSIVEALIEQPQQLLSLLMNAETQGDHESIFTDLRELMSNENLSKDVRIAPLADGGFEALVEKMKDYSTSETVQAEGCKCLAFLYYHYPLQNLNVPTQLPNGSFATIHSENSIDCLQKAMSSQRPSARVQREGLCALMNFILPLALVDHSPEKEAISSRISCFLQASLDAISIHNESPEVLVVVARLYPLLFDICKEDDLRRWNTRFLQQLFEAQKKFPAHSELALSTYGCLSTLTSDRESLDFMASTFALGILCERLASEEESEELLAYLSEVVSVILEEVPTACSHIGNLSEVTQHLKLLLKRTGGCMEIQWNVLKMLESIIAFGDFGIRGVIGDKEGMEVLCESLRNSLTEPIMVKSICDVLSLVIPAVEEQSLVVTGHVLGTALMDVFESPDMEDFPEAQAAVIDVLATCCSRLEGFKQIILENSDFIDCVIDSMLDHLASEELQRSGCCIIWVLSSTNEGKEVLGVRGAVKAVINGMLQNCESSAIQKEGLTAIKNLSMSSMNKPLLDAVKGEDAVRFSLWIHIKDPQVLSSGYSALNNLAVDSRNKQVNDMDEDTLKLVSSCPALDSI